MSRALFHRGFVPACYAKAQGRGIIGDYNAEISRTSLAAQFADHANQVLVRPGAQGPGTQIHRLILLYPITSEDWAGFLITIKASDARLPKSRGMRRTRWYAAVTRDEGNAADDVLMVDQGLPLLLTSMPVSLMMLPHGKRHPTVSGQTRTSGGV
jgi:hypothetical protein